MHVSEAVAARKSVRAFLDRPVPEDLLRELLTKASRAPSGGNLQPSSFQIPQQVLRGCSGKLCGFHGLHFRKSPLHPWFEKKDLPREGNF